MKQTIPELISHFNHLSELHILPPEIYNNHRERQASFVWLRSAKEKIISNNPLDYLTGIQNRPATNKQFISIELRDEVRKWGIGIRKWFNFRRFKGKDDVEMIPTLYICPYSIFTGNIRKEAVQIPFPTTTGRIYNVIHELKTINQYFINPKEEKETR